jgi:hypothetical protein
MRDSKAEFQFIDFTRHNPTPPAEKPGLGPLPSNLRASGPKDEADYLDRIARSRRGAVWILVAMVAALTLADWLGVIS